MTAESEHAFTIGTVLKLFPSITRGGISFWIYKGYLPFPETGYGNPRQFDREDLTLIGVAAALHQAGFPARSACQAAWRLLSPKLVLGPEGQLQAEPAEIFAVRFAPEEGNAWNQSALLPGTCTYRQIQSAVGALNTSDPIITIDLNRLNADIDAMLLSIGADASDE